MGITWQLAKGFIENWLLNPESPSTEHPVVKQLELVLRGWLEDPTTAILSVLRELSDRLATRMTLNAHGHSQLDEWAARWNLCDDWCKLWAIQTMIHWSFDRKSGLEWHYPWGKESVRLRPLTVSLRPWHITAETCAAYESYARRAFEKELRQYCDGAERWQLPRSPEKRYRDDLQWLALYQVKGKSAAGIWKGLLRGDKRGRTAVHKAIVDLSKEIDLTLRKST